MKSLSAMALGPSAVLPQLRKVPESFLLLGHMTVPLVYVMHGMDSSSELWRAIAKPSFA